METRGSSGKDTKCWHCQNAVPGKHCGCSWSERLQPVEGWKAIPEQLAGMRELSYRVLECPEFVPDSPEKWGKNKGTISDEAYLRLAEAILKHTFRSYRQTLKSWEHYPDEGTAYAIYQMEREILSPFFEALTVFSCDLLDVINSMRRRHGLEPRSEEWRQLQND